MHSQKVNAAPPRRGAVLVLAAVVMVAVFAFAAFSADVGYMALVKQELQNAADAAALGAARELGRPTADVRLAATEVAAENMAAQLPVSLTDPDIELGVYDLLTRTFTVNEAAPNAVRVTARTLDRPLFFGPVIQHDNFDMAANSVAMLSPRDIVFVVDLSGAMNDDTEPCWATQTINDTYAAQGYPVIGDDLMQQVYDDFGFGMFPGTVQHVGQPLGVAADEYAYARLTADDGPLSGAGTPWQYDIKTTDSEATRKLNAYRWMIDQQIAAVMPNVTPAPDSSTNYAWWEKYLDYVIPGVWVGESDNGGVLTSTPGLPRNGSNAGGVVPSPKDSDEIGGFNNPNPRTFPAASSTLPQQWQSKIGYRTYLQFLMDWGRDRSPLLSNSQNAASGALPKTPLSRGSIDCPYHGESTTGGSLSFPPSEQPMHAVRRALIAALAEVELRNASLQAGAGDKVAIVTFDGLDADHSAQLRVPLTADYAAAMSAAANLQAVGDLGNMSATEAGLQLARDHVRDIADGGQGRSFAEDAIVLITVGTPNAAMSDPLVIDNFAAENPAADWYAAGNSSCNAPLMQAQLAVQDDIKLYAVGVGLGADYDFIDRMARMGGTAKNGLGPRGSGNPADYEQVLIEVIHEIIDNPKGRIVK